MKRQQDILNEQLRALDPVRPEDFDGGRAEQVLATILAIDPEDGREETADRGGVRQLIPRWGVVPAAAVLVVALVLAIGLLDRGDGEVGVAAALTDVATAAAAQNPPVASAPYLFLKTRSLSVDTAVSGGEAWSVHSSETRREWVSPDGAALVRIESEPPTFVGPGDRVAWERAGSPRFAHLDGPTRTREETLPAGSVEDLAGLSTDPDALAVQLRSEAEATRTSAPVPARMLELIGEALRNPTASPQLRAALYEAALQAPGIEYLGPATDPNGRKGLAVGVTSNYSGGPTVYSLVYDPESTAILANESTALAPGYADADGPIVISATVYLESGSVDSLPSP